MKYKIFTAIWIVIIIGLAIALVSTSSSLREKNESIEILGLELDEKNKNVKELTDELDFTKSENSKLLADLKSGGEFYEGRITELEAQLAEKTQVSEKLASEIKKYKEQTGIDLTALMQAIEGIETYIENNSPLVRVKLSEEEFEKLKNEKDEDDYVYDHKWLDAEKYINQAKEKLGDKYDSDMTLAELLERGEQDADAPNIAIYYENITTGYKYSYNGDKVFDSASVMKAPYITAVLKAYTDYKNGDIKPDGKDERYSSEKLAEMFDFERVIVLDEENTNVKGSGVLKDKPLGTEVTFDELFTYSLKNSDNIAFRILKKNFTNKWYYNLVRENGVKSPLTYEMNLTANEAGKLFKEIYYFTLENEEYGEMVKAALADSAHTVLSKNVLPNSIHKYGWDENAYHDAAIVYGEKPYIAIVFTDIDSGGTKADAYIREIFKKIMAFHKSLG